MVENKIELKSVSDLLGMNFFIPSYQRGYRWTEQQVKDLLNDIEEFDPLKDGNFYCLQPLVVHKQKKEEDLLFCKIKQEAKDLNEVMSFLSDKWNVVDGQQRLTTIFLILRILNNSCFSLEFERERLINLIDGIPNNRCFPNDKKEDEIVDAINDKWEDLCKNSEVKDKPDMYYLFLAKSIIYAWWNKKEEKQKEIFKKKILNYVKFLWYDIGDNEDEHKLFENLNSGKIALTNAELIKALFINNVQGDSFTRELQQSIIADEFDQMERALRKDDMWYFLAGNQEKPSSCLDLLFNLILDSSKESKNYRDKDYRSFFYIKENLNDNINWDDVKKMFFVLQGWYENALTFNLIGYLRTVGIKLKDILSWWNDDKHKDKLAFEKKLREECFNTIKDDFLSCRFDKDKDKVQKVLLLFNIAALVEIPEEKGKPSKIARFSFENYHNNHWNVEHISPQNPNLNHDELLKLLKEKHNIKEKDETKEKSLVEMFPILEDLVKALEDKNEDSINTELKKFFAIEGDDVMSLSNLTLLSEHDNKGIGNNFFFAKRDKLKQYYQQGSFIPIGSLNVFSKFYSTNPKQPLFWDKVDASDYLNKIEQTINNFKSK